MNNFDQIVSGASNTQTDTGAVATQRNRIGKSSLVLALVTSALAIGLDVFAESLPSIIENNQINPLAAFNLFGIFRRLVVGVIGLAAVICAVISLRTPHRPRGIAAAGFALGAFHVVFVLTMITSDLLRL